MQSTFDWQAQLLNLVSIAAKRAMKILADISTRINTDKPPADSQGEWRDTKGNLIEKCTDWHDYEQMEDVTSRVNRKIIEQELKLATAQGGQKVTHTPVGIAARPSRLIESLGEDELKDEMRQVFDKTRTALASVIRHQDRKTGAHQVIMVGLFSKTRPELVLVLTSIRSFLSRGQMKPGWVQLDRCWGKDKGPRNDESTINGASNVVFAGWCAVEPDVLLEGVIGKVMSRTLAACLGLSLRASHSR